MSTEALIAQKRAEIAAKLAAMKKNVSQAPTPSPISTPLSHGASPSPAPGLPAADDVARKVAEARKLVAQAQSKLAVKDNPYMVCSLTIMTIYVNDRSSLSPDQERAKRHRLNLRNKELG